MEAQESIDLNLLKKKYPLLNDLVDLEEVFWQNSNLEKSRKGLEKSSLTIRDVQAAEERLERFSPYIAKVFPDTFPSKGLIESPLVEIETMKSFLSSAGQQEISGRLLLKCDSHLPISGSIKARGGIYEILKHAETLAMEHKLLTIEDNYSILDSSRFRDFFSNFSVAVGSTGNLGLSIGIISAKLGFKVAVHMSADAKKWKKDLLRSKGVKVIEYAADYSKAVEEGRKQAAADPACYFVDDENSRDLFLGYAVAAFRLKKQMEELGIVTDENHPLFVYLPCGVGGGPGGVAFGLKLVFGDNVHCFFAEPVHSPCMLLGLMTGYHDQISVQDAGIDNKTEADGLAVGRPSGFVGKIIEPFLSGSYTVSDEKLYLLLKALTDTEGIRLEPSALAGMIGPVTLLEKGTAYLARLNLQDNMDNGAHIVWATGGSMVPDAIMNEYYQKAVDLEKCLNEKIL